MQLTVTLILQIVGLVLLAMAGLNVPNKPRLVWGWLGMFFWLLSLMLVAVSLHPVR
jgi:hypothetical protein